jgi:hypothetical protein
MFKVTIQIEYLRNVYEIVFDPGSCGSIHVMESGTINTGINFASHDPVHWRTSVRADCYNTVLVTKCAIQGGPA